MADDSHWPVEQSLVELSQLASTAGLVTVGQAVQRRQRPHPATFIGSGKVSQVVQMVADLAADVVLFDEELSPRHQRELESALGENVKLLDRTALILAADYLAGCRVHSLRCEGEHTPSRSGRVIILLFLLECGIVNL